MRNKLLLLPACALAGVLLTGLALLPGPAEARPGEPAIRVALKAAREVTLASTGSGVVVALPVPDGGRFTRGDTLLQLECSVLEAQAQGAEAQARRQELICKSNERLARLDSKSSLEAEVSRAEADAAAAEALAMRNMVRRCRIEAPYSGVVGELLVRENQFLSEGQPVMTILDDSSLLLEFLVPSRWVTWFQPGYKFSFSVDETGGTHQAELERLGGQVDPISQSIKAYARVLTDDEATGREYLIPGMSGTARLEEPAVSSARVQLDRPGEDYGQPDQR